MMQNVFLSDRSFICRVLMHALTVSHLCVQTKFECKFILLLLYIHVFVNREPRCICQKIYLWSNHTQMIFYWSFKRRIEGEMS